MAYWIGYGASEEKSRLNSSNFAIFELVKFLGAKMSYIRILLIAAITILDTLKAVFEITFIKRPKFYQTAKRWAKKVLRISGIKLKLEGLENIDINETYVFVSNHSSLYDIPVLQASLPVNFRIIYKKELEKIPVFGWGLKKSPYIGIVREDPRLSMKSIEAAIESIKMGDSVLIYPEGTRTPDGNLQEFKRGAFMLAGKSGKPIVPIAIIGTFPILANGIGGIKPAEVIVKIGEPIYYTIGSKKDELDLMQLVHEKISQLLK